MVVCNYLDLCFLANGNKCNKKELDGNTTFNERSTIMRKNV